VVDYYRIADYPGNVADCYKIADYPGKPGNSYSQVPLANGQTVFQTEMGLAVLRQEHCLVQMGIPVLQQENCLVQMDKDLVAPHSRYLARMDKDFVVRRNTHMMVPLGTSLGSTS